MRIPCRNITYVRIWQLATYSVEHCCSVAECHNYACMEVFDCKPSALIMRKILKRSWVLAESFFTISIVAVIKLIMHVVIHRCSPHLAGSQQHQLPLHPNPPRRCRCRQAHRSLRPLCRKRQYQMSPNSRSVHPLRRRTPR